MWNVSVDCAMTLIGRYGAFLRTISAVAPSEESHQVADMFDFSQCEYANSSTRPSGTATSTITGQKLAMRSAIIALGN